MYTKNLREAFETEYTLLYNVSSRCGTKGLRTITVTNSFRRAAEAKLLTS